MGPDGIPGADSAAPGAPSGPPADAPGDATAPSASWLTSLQGLARELPGLVSDRIEILSLELQCAGRVLAKIVALVVAAAILAVTAWLALWAGVTMALIHAGLHWAAASLTVLVINLGACWWAVARVRSLAPLLSLPATRRNLTLRRQTQTTAGSSSSADEEHPHAAAAARTR